MQRRRILLTHRPHHTRRQPQLIPHLALIPLILHIRLNPLIPQLLQDQRSTLSTTQAHQSMRTLINHIRTLRLMAIMRRIRCMGILLVRLREGGVKNL